MTIILPTLAVAFTAFCVWLTVRIVNRRERWAKWTLAGVVGLPVLYVASFGPACWITSSINFGEPMIPIVYRPVIWAMRGPKPIREAVFRYSLLSAADGWNWYGFAQMDDDGEELLRDSDGNLVLDQRWLPAGSLNN